MVTDEKSDAFFRVHEADAVVRSTFPGSNCSGFFKWPVDT
jgi:hypothetical protein